MRWFRKTKQEGLSLRIAFILMLVGFLLVTTVLLVMANLTIRSFYDLSEATDTYISLQNAASDLMSASDYLTEEAQCYTVLGDRKHLDNYFIEAEQTCRREKAIATMEGYLPESDALSELKGAMSNSLALMDREYYAMRLVLDACGDSDIPAAMRDVALTDRDSALSAEEKQTLAAQMMHDEEYYTQKNLIRTHLNRCIEDLKNTTHGTQTLMEQYTRRDLVITVILVIVQSVGLILMLWLTTSLGINPLLRAVEHIKRDQGIPIVGAREFRYLADTYNKMYTAYKRSIAKLSYKASHDKLTGLYNRAGYDLVIQSVDPATTAFLLFDADRFKSINDTMGHEAGDRILKRIAAALKHYFRSDDHICRLGGDEFVVLMIHVNEHCEHMIEQKVESINRELAVKDGGLPPVSVSVGVTLCRNTNDVTEMFREADAALYHVKENARGKCGFYREHMKINRKKPSSSR